MLSEAWITSSYPDEMPYENLSHKSVNWQDCLRSANIKTAPTAEDIWREMYCLAFTVIWLNNISNFFTENL